MRIAILSDSHDHWKHLTDAVRIANEKQCKLLLFAGDLISPPMLPILEQFDGKIHLVLGNNEGEISRLTGLIAGSKNITFHGSAVGNFCEIEVEGLKFFMNHYPKIGEVAAKSGNYDVVIYGHDHTYHMERIGNTLFLNPGEVQGYKTGTAGFAIMDTKTLAVEQIILEKELR